MTKQPEQPVDPSESIGEEFTCLQCGYIGNETGEYFHSEYLGAEYPECPKCGADYWNFSTSDSWDTNKNEV
mgnify:CR=1 FL=1